MQYTVTSQYTLQKSPLYSVNTSLNSFILFNDETFSKQVTLTKLMADREEEVNTTEGSKQFAAFENFRKPSTGLELQVMHPSLFNLHSQENIPRISEEPEELKLIQLSTDI